jgi:UDP-glucose 4-epimerase
MVLPRFAAQAVAGQPLTVYGDGKQQRCFCHVTDAVEALVGIAEVESAYGRVFNVGSQEETSIHQLAQRVIEQAESDSEIAFVPYEEAYEEGFEDMARRIPDLTRIEKKIGWRPIRSLDEIIGDVVEAARTPASPVPAG